MTEPEIKYVTFEDVERRLISQARTPYYNWLRLVITLALASLTGLIALQGHYIPQEPTSVFLLAIGWSSLVFTIVSGLFVLRSEYFTPLDAAREIRLMRKIYGDSFAAEQLEQNRPVSPGRFHGLAVYMMTGSFILALISICSFSVINLPWAG